MSDASKPFSFEGARQAMLRDVIVNTTAENRIHWLERALKVAEASGALARRREQERRELASDWGEEVN